MTVVSAAVVAFGIQMNGSLEDATSIILLTFLLAGFFQLVFGFLNIAGYVKYFPYPVISGFMSGVGLIIVILQIFPFVGLDSAKSTLAVIQDLPRLFAEANTSALLLGIITIAIYFLFPLITKAIPSALVALIVATLIAYLGQMDVPLIGEIPSGLPSFQLGGILSVDPAAYPKIIEFGLVLAVLGSIDSLLTSVIADNMTKTKHNSNRELIGQGIGNMLAAAIGGIPGAGATKGTVVNINAGGRTRLSGIIHGLFLLTVLLGLGSLAAHIPLCVLAGLLIPIGFKIVDFKGLKHILKVPRADAIVLLLVLSVTTFGSLIHAVGIGIALACLLFMKQSGDIGEKGLEVDKLSELEEDKPWQDEIELYEKYKDKVVIKHLYGPLFFGFTSYFKDQVKALPDEIGTVILRMDRVPYIDQSGLYALEDILFDMHSRKTDVILVGLQEQPLDMLEAIGIIPDLISKEAVFENIDDSFAYLRTQLDE
jgi:SulP family sulfate permease